MRCGGIIVVAAVGLALPVAGQEASGPVPLTAPAQTGPAQAPLVVIDPERLFRESAFGRASAARITAEQAALVAENRRFDAALEAEERDLTDRRATLPAEEFRALAAAFDRKAEGIRSAQAEKDRAIVESQQADQQRFLQVAAPELARMMADVGAVAMLDKQLVFLSFDSIDVTDSAIARVDAALGDGTVPDDAEPPAPPTPSP
jgi:Skp family chaperone for outer membrane proteins